MPVTGPIQMRDRLQLDRQRTAFHFHVGPRHIRFCAVLLVLVCWSAIAGVTAASEEEDRFERHIRPLLIERCHQCHAAKLAKGGLRLDSREAVLRGGDSGPAVVVGQPAKSLLLEAIRQQNGLSMPPDGKLTESQISHLAWWIETGLIWPGAEADMSTKGAAPAQTVLTPNAGDLSTSLQLWLKADALRLDDGDPVTVWPDSSGQGRDVAVTKGVRADGVGLPGKFVKHSTLMKRPAVRFETTTGYASSPDRPVDIQGDAALSILLVINLQPHDAQPPFDGVFGIGNPANPVSNPGRPLAALVQINRTEDHALHFAGGWNHDASLGSGSFKPHYGQTILLSIIKQPGPMRTTTQVFINGEPAVRADGGQLEGAETVPDIQHRTDIGVYLGKAVSWAGSIQGDVGEVLVYNMALASSERLAIERHLAEKYGKWLPALQQVAAAAPFTDEEKAFWAYQPLRDSAPPTVRDESRSQFPLDRFVAARLETLGITPSPPADKLTLLRRVTFDLTGLPPTPEEVDAFLADYSPEAYAKVVDRLLDSPSYGERWARHWLDVVRYAETTANDANAVMRYAWRYRNYVIDAFNSNLPYNQFLIEQLAGDLLPAMDSVDVNTRRMIATGYLMVGPKALAETDKEQSRLDIVDDQLDVVGRTLLGLTWTCARCHDHKFDAIRTTDYYALAGIFRSTEPFQNEVRNATMWWEFPVPQRPGDAPLIVMAPKESVPRNLKVHLRGNRFTLGGIAPRGVPGIFQAVAASSGDHSSFPDPNQMGSGRLELARWIVSPTNPLTARVMVNRLWQHHFSRGIVASSDNFGTRGERPSHPELLDWLAKRFLESGWNVKAMQRMMVLSHTYRQRGVSDSASAAQTADPENRWLSSFPRRRLSAEELRDAVLTVSGKLDRIAGAEESAEFLVSKAENIGAMILPNRVAADDPFYTTFSKRSIYLPVVRNMLPDVLALFDAADPNSVTAQRTETTVASQSLFLLNSPFMREQSLAFADRLLADPTRPAAERIDQAHRLAYGRSAAATEQAEAVEFLAAYAKSSGLPSAQNDARTRSAWQSYCQTLFCSNEFLYVE